MSKEKTKPRTISLTDTEFENLEKISKDQFGRENKSGMIRYWINKALKNIRS